MADGQRRSSMNLHLKAFKPNRNYYHFHVLLDKVNCGHLNMKKEDARSLVKILTSGVEEIKLTGDWG